jgi:hypothetical protein
MSAHPARLVIMKYSCNPAPSDTWRRIELEQPLRAHSRFDLAQVIAANPKIGE